MNKWITISIIVVLLPGIGVTGALYAQESSELKEAQSEIVALQGNVSTLEAELAAAEAQVSALETDLAAYTNTVTIMGFTFYPGTIIVPAGTTVTWTNQDSEEHTVTSDDHTSSFDGDLVFRNSFSYTFTERGIYNYHCHNHDEMQGTVIVE